MDQPEQSAAGNEQKTRFAAMFVAAVVAIVFIMPLERHGSHKSWDVLAAGLAPAGIAWLIIRDRPARQGPALFRGISLVLALIGFVGLGLHLVAGHTSGLTRETVETGRFAIQAWVYLGAGVLGLIGSVLFGPDDQTD